MIVEIEFLEQIVDNSWSLSRSIRFLNSRGKVGWSVVGRHLKDGNVALISADGAELPDWRVREILRMKNAEDLTFVRCTAKGAGLV